MPTQTTQTEQQQAKEFLKRAEIRTMKKDLRALRETDALKERDKIVKIQPLQEQEAEQAKKMQAKESIKLPIQQQNDVETVLSRNAGEEHKAEKDLKNYATEEERQQIFLLESQRIGLEKQFDDIEKQKEPALKLEENKLLIDAGDLRKKLQPLVDQEKKTEDEQTLLAQKAQSTTIPAERKSLEQRKSDLDKTIQDIEKKRWEIEKSIEEISKKISGAETSFQAYTTEKNSLTDKILGMDKSLREIYSGVIARTEEKRRGQSQEQLEQKKAAEDTRAKQNEIVQRQQRSGMQNPQKDKPFLQHAPESFKEKMKEESQTEEEQRKKFLQKVQILADTGTTPKNQEPAPAQKPTEPSILSKNADANPQQPNINKN